MYCTLQMGRSSKKRYFIGCTAAYLGGLLLKANFGIYPLFAAVYLLCVKYDWKRLLKQGLILAGVVLCFLIPWTVRNYCQFHAFIPLTYGAGNPMLEGTYQGMHYPEDDELDYVTNVDEVVREKFAAYYGEDGNPLPQYKRFVSLQRDKIKAEYRLREWAKKDGKSLAYSMAVLKPTTIVNGTFYFSQVFDIKLDTVLQFQQYNTWLCIGVIATSLILKKYRAQVGFLVLTYLGNVYLYAATYAYGRYNLSLMCLRMILIGLGLALFIEALRRALKLAQKREQPLSCRH